MGFGTRTRTSAGSFWLGTGINLFIVIVAWILGTIFHIAFGWLVLPVLILIGLAIYLSGARIIHPIWFTLGLLFGVSLILVALILLVALGLIAWLVVFG